MHNALREKGISNHGSFSVNHWKREFARGMGNMATQQLVIGALSEAEHNNHRRIELTREIEDEHSEAIGHRELGQVLFYRGEWNNAEQELRLALSMFEKEQYFSGQGVTWSYLALWKIIESREYKKAFDVKEAINRISFALNCQNEWTKQNFPIEREKVRNFWLLGAAYRANNELTLAEENLSKALNLCRQINLVDAEADILLNLARLRYAQGDFKDAQEKASEALVITERSGYVLQGADVNLFLAQYALEQEKDKAKAKEYAESALRLAYCDGPPYYYKVAYEEAERMIAKLNDEG
jgi:tetratricopeptide (TPR) repeat protein